MLRHVFGLNVFIAAWHGDCPWLRDCPQSNFQKTPNAPIEVTFKAIKHIIGGLCFHFWTKAWEVSKGKSLATEDIKKMFPRDKRLIAEAMNAVDAFVNFAMIATGCLQILVLDHAQEIIKRHRLWMRTAPSDVPFEEIVQKVIQHEFYHNFRKYKHTSIYAIIREKRQHIPKRIFRKAA